MIVLKKTVRFGDEHSIELPEEPIDCSKLGYFDELEEDCWNLVKQYAGLFGLEIIPDDPDEENAISFDVAKGLQDYIIEQFENAGVTFDFDGQKETEDEGMNMV